MEAKLEALITIHISKNYRGASVIIMHPMTWKDLTRHIFITDSVAIDTSPIKLKYRSIKVLRSLDVAEGEFEVY